jgi:predicted house-cleaning noncanonical NTP pyrophosphatase (MazG superfamily)
MASSKLIRDKIPEIIEQNQGKPITHIAGEEEYWLKLKEKLQEEVDEFKEEGNEEELADVLEVIDAIIEFKQIDKSNLNKLKEDKAEKRGKFRKRIILDYIK